MEEGVEPVPLMDTAVVVMDPLDGIKVDLRFVVLAEHTWSYLLPPDWGRTAKQYALKPLTKPAKRCILLFLNNIYRKCPSHGR